MYLVTYSGPRLGLLTGGDTGRNHYYIILWPSQQVSIVSNINTIRPSISHHHHNVHTHIRSDNVTIERRVVFIQFMETSKYYLAPTQSRLYPWFVTAIKEETKNQKSGKSFLFALNIFFPSLWLCADEFVFFCLLC